MICDTCGRPIIPGNRPDGIPGGVSFILQDGTQVNYCADCVIRYGVEAQNIKTIEQCSKEEGAEHE